MSIKAFRLRSNRVPGDLFFLSLCALRPAVNFLQKARDERDRAGSGTHGR